MESFHSNRTVSFQRPRMVIFPPVINDAQRYLDAHFTENINIADIASRFFYTREHLARLFRRYLNIGVIAEHILMIYLLLIEKKIINEGSVYARTESHLWTFSSVLDYIQQHYTEPITLAQVCEYIQCSKSYVSHAFKQFTGTTFKKYLNNLRITKAQEMLKKNASINETALACGFVDPNYFSIVFKEITRMTPTDFKKKNCL